MKKYGITRKLIICVVYLMVLSLVIYGVPVFVSDPATNNSDEITEIINAYRTDPDVLHKISGSKVINSFDGSSTYTLYALSPYGYAIF